jgi:hypothetical protein
MRASYVFHFMRNGTAHPVLVSSSNHGTTPHTLAPTAHRPPTTIHHPNADVIMAAEQ